MSNSDKSVSALKAAVDLRDQDEGDNPHVRVYCAFAVGEQIWNVQIFGGKRKNTPMCATASLTRKQLTELRDTIDECLEK